MRRSLRNILELLTFDPTPIVNIHNENIRLREALAQAEHRAAVAEKECERLTEVIARRERVLAADKP